MKSSKVDSSSRRIPRSQGDSLDDPTNPFWMDIASLTLLLMALYLGRATWQTWFSSTDYAILISLSVVGILMALARSTWVGQLSQFRVWSARVLLASSVVLICLGFAFANSQCGIVAGSLILAGWCMGRVRGDSSWHAAFLGLVLFAPAIIAELSNQGYFNWFTSTTVAMTSMLANLLGQPHVALDDSILFSQGIADRFSCYGDWDGLVSLLGVALLCILGFRRKLVPSSICLALTPFIWIAVRSIAWIVLSYLAKQSESWFEWSIGLELGLFAVCVALVVSLDQFLACIFKPIPFGLFNAESPLSSFMWNWICGLPRLELRIPADHKIALRWRTRIKLANKVPSFRTDFDWLKLNFLALLFHPIRAIGSIIDAVRGWRYSRNWLKFAIHLPSAGLLIIAYTSLLFSGSNRNDNQTQVFVDESLKLCSTKSLELSGHNQQEEGFCKAVISPEPRIVEEAATISDRTKRYLELLGKRILSLEPSNLENRYRLGLVLSLNGDNEQAESSMQEIVNGRYAEYPAANSWLAKNLIIKKGAGIDVSIPELLNHLESASKRKDIDFRLLLLYANLLLEQGKNQRAVEVTKQAVLLKPEFILDLARVYARIGDDEGRIAAANQAENYFVAKINFPNEKELDRLSVAEARLLTNRPDEAAEVLLEGLRQKVAGERSVRQLSEIQGLIYMRSIQKKEDGTYQVDLTLLETMADTDPTNPSVSSEIAKLLPFKVRPTKKLLDVLKKQISLGITSVPSLLLLGEGYYAIGNLTEAQRYWELAVAREPQNFSALNNLATCLVELSASNAERAVELVTRANSFSPDNPDILDTWGDVLVAGNRPKEALNKYELAIRLDKGRLATRKKLKKAYESVGMKEMAELQSQVIQSLEQDQSKSKTDVPIEKAP